MLYIYADGKIDSLGKHKLYFWNQRSFKISYTEFMLHSAIWRIAAIEFFYLFEK